MSGTSTGHQHDPGRYEIRVQGRVESRWAAWFDGMTLATAGDGTTVLAGWLADQSALHGVLARIRDLGLPLITVTRIDADPPPSSSGSR